MSLSLRVEGLGKRHGKNWIFRNLNFDVEAGDSLALLGANGSGKSSLLRTLCAFDPISEGNVQWTTNGGDSPRGKRSWLGLLLRARPIFDSRLDCLGAHCLSL